MRLLLASQSSARRRMLEAAGVAFATVDAPLDEERAKAGLAGIPPDQVALRLAEAKASAVTAADALVIGADQTLELDDGAMLSKPRSRQDARDQLLRMSGRQHRLHAGAAIAENGAIVWRAMESVTLTMRPLSEDFVDRYLDAEYDHVRWNVGGYRIEGPGIQLFDHIDGSHFAILGLPLMPLLAYLRERQLMPS